jgi:predicted RNA-binding protein
MVDRDAILVEMKTQTIAMKDIMYDQKEILKVLSENIKQINDANILHHSTNSAQIVTIKEKIQQLMDKHFWLIVFFAVCLMIALGYNEILSILS